MCNLDVWVCLRIGQNATTVINKITFLLRHHRYQCIGGPTEDLFCLLGNFDPPVGHQIFHQWSKVHKCYYNTEHWPNVGPLWENTTGGPTLAQWTMLAHQCSAIWVVLTGTKGCARGMKLKFGCISVMFWWLEVLHSTILGGYCRQGSLEFFFTWDECIEYPTTPALLIYLKKRQRTTGSTWQRNWVKICWLKGDCACA